MTLAPAVKACVPVSLPPFKNCTQVVLVPVKDNLYRLGWRFGTLDRSIHS